MSRERTPARTVTFHTLGCRLNQAETEALATDFARAGWHIGRFGEPADACIVNTCTVTATADRKSRSALSQAARSARGGVVIATGCYVERARKELEAGGRITYAVGNRDKARIFALVDAHFRGEAPPLGSLEPAQFAYTAAGGHTRTRAAVKVQDGCNNFCSYCIIPFVRGRAVSRPAAAVLEEVRVLVDRGVRELVITGVNMGRYEDGQTDLAGLLGSILEVPGDYRVRLSSLEPEPFGERFVELFDHPRMCPHLHLCLQSGSDRILLAMRRTYTIADYLGLVERLRARRPSLNITTDVIVGFPGESDADFEATCRVIRQVGFGHIHTFRYSPREGTRATRMPGEVPEAVKNERSQIVRSLAIEGKRRYRASLVGRRERLLVEKTGTVARGYGEHYAPIAVRHPNARRNEFLDVRVVGLGPGDDPVLQGAPV